MCVLNSVFKLKLHHLQRRTFSSPSSRTIFFRVELGKSVLYALRRWRINVSEQRRMLRICSYSYSYTILFAKVPTPKVDFSPAFVCVRIVKRSSMGRLTVGEISISLHSDIYLPPTHTHKHTEVHAAAFRAAPASQFSFRCLQPPFNLKNAAQERFLQRESIPKNNDLLTCFPYKSFLKASSYKCGTKFP